MGEAVSEPKRKITQWSYSTYKSYKTCPRKVKLAKIDKIRDPGSAATERGERIHAEAEAFVKRELAKLPLSLLKFKSQFNGLIKMKNEVKAEEEWAVTRSWKACAWGDYDAWLRAKIDAYYIDGGTITIIDYKTGKIYPDNKAQVGLYALLAFERFPIIRKARVQLWYLDQGETVEETYTRDEAIDMKAQWEHATANMLADDIFPPRPGMHCRWCFYSARNNGNCEF